MMRAFKLLAIAAAMTVTTACTTVSLNESNIIRPQRGDLLAAKQVEEALPKGYALSSDFLTAEDGEKLYRVRFTHPGARSVLLFFGGNMATVSGSALRTAQILARDWTPEIVIADYRGYGQSGGKPDAATLNKDALALFDEEQRRAKASGKKLVIGGYSLGSVVAGALLGQRTPDGALLVATVTNVSEWVEARTPWYVRPFTSFRIDPKLEAFDNARALRSYQGPLLIVAGNRDKLVPAALGERLFAAAATPAAAKRFVTAPEADHGNVMQSDEFRRGLTQFVEQNKF